MTTAAVSQTRPTVSVAARTPVGIDEIEAWLYEVGPIVRALAPQRAVASVGRRRWLATQVRLGAEALVFLEGELYEAEALDHPAHELHWLHGRVAALVDAARPRPALPAAA